MVRARFSLLVFLALAPALAGARDKPTVSKEALSQSLGTPSRGELVRGKRLAIKGRYHTVIAVTQQRGFVYGTAEMVALIKRVGRVVGRKHSGAKLQVGNISRRGGGKIPQSVTHNSGRDVDLLFYARDDEGEVAPTTGFIRYDKRGHSGDFRFDVPRNWTLVKALLRDRKAQVQSILVAHWLEKKLIAQARKKKEPGWLIKRAQVVLRQPRRSSPHDDHFHVRIYCARHERLEGCLNRGPVHDWARTYDGDVAELAKQLQREIGSKNPGVSASAITRLGRLEVVSAAPAIAKALEHESLAVRRAAIRALERLNVLDEYEVALAKAAHNARPGGWRARLLRALADHQMAAGAPVFVAVLADQDATAAGRAVAARGVGALLHTDGVKPLITALSDKDRAVRDTAGKALKRITNHHFGQGKAAVAQWRDWYRENGKAGRSTWVRLGFEAALGLQLTPKGCVKAVKKLVGVVKRGGDDGLNARSLIADITGYDPRRVPRSRKRAHQMYTRWLRKGGARKCKKRVAKLKFKS